MAFTCEMGVEEGFELGGDDCVSVEFRVCRGVDAGGMWGFFSGFLGVGIVVCG